ncbi:His-Xaa-Ser system radical SAM maturase HxsC [Sphingorhabdus soli]|uniref:His-Xaa-Ser system radical SAM maturase HxsC n=1 Tax=Flavisphingopyxis soli TaxID=2601267 RepID=A0A5C6UK29_9SPHN|nr:His-Xaa-Ser system radical SAM maturase HxsC [Sphingorhabdus soli]TXC73372.1 His-Xaa-Ser system radical SAM maturase HxsC [Sphingorhabdus soli]
MIPLNFEIQSDEPEPFVARLTREVGSGPADFVCRSQSESRSLWCGDHGLLEIVHNGENIEGDIMLVDPENGRADRVIRATSKHNTLLVTEQCDQLCVMCSQPPKKTHLDRFKLFEEACLLAPAGMVIGISGGEPTLHMDALLGMIESVLRERSDLSFHILSNAQHFEQHHILRLCDPVYRNVVWGIPLYSSDPVVHDTVVAKPGAYERLISSFEHLLLAAARIELRTVLTATTVPGLSPLSRFIARNLPHIEQWSLMGLENIGFAKNRWDDLYADLNTDFSDLAAAIDWAQLHGIATKIFNLPLCHIPQHYRSFAVASISDWKQRFGKSCVSCRAKRDCSGFFEWHPDKLVDEVTPL